MAKPVHLILFDVDGTLILSGGAGRRAMSAAFEALFGVPEAMRAVRPHGMTDPLICQEMFRAHLGRPGTEAECAALIGRYLDALPPTVAGSAAYRVMPGVPALLEALSGREDIALGLGTGNVERGARIKLERAGLNRFFPFGGFGCDAADRAEVIAAGFRRGEARLRRERPGRGAVRWVVGDTGRDVAAGRACGARTVAVATGGASLAELAGASPDHLFPDFSETGSVLSLFNGAG